MLSLRKRSAGRDRKKSDFTQNDGKARAGREFAFRCTGLGMCHRLPFVTTDFLANAFRPSEFVDRDEKQVEELFCGLGPDCGHMPPNSGAVLWEMVQSFPACVFFITNRLNEGLRNARFHGMPWENRKRKKPVYQFASAIFQAFANFNSRTCSAALLSEWYAFRSRGKYAHSSPLAIVLPVSGQTLENRALRKYGSFRMVKTFRLAWNSSPHWRAHYSPLRAVLWL